jgi:hypothetical protein
MKTHILIGLGFITCASSQAATITQWDFNGTSATTVAGGASTPTASIGVGSASLLNGVTGSFSSGISNGGSSDTVTTSPPNFGWQTTGFSAQNTTNGASGVQFMVSTVGFNNISVKFDTRHSNTSSRWIRLDYTTNGGSTWNLGSSASGRVYEGNAGDTWFNLRSASLTGDAAVNNNAAFGVRMVAVFGPASGPFDDSLSYTSYAASNATSAYAATGTLRWDMVTVSGSPVPEPATLAVLGLGAAAMIRRRRKN